MRTNGSVPQVGVAGTVAQAAHIAGTGLAQPHAGSPVQFAVATLVLSTQGDGCISVPDQLHAALQDVANTSLREGRLSQQTIVGALSRHTAMNRQEAEQVAQQVENQWNQTGGGAMRAAENAWTSTRNAALGALRSLGGAFWWMFASFAVSLLGSIGGGILGTRIHRPRRQKVGHEHEREHVVTTRPIGAPAHQST
jgi:hypothetical protein